MQFTDEERKELEGKYSPEFLEKLEACGSAEEVEKLIANQGVKLSLDELDQISGGAYTIDLPDGDSIYVPYDIKPDEVSNVPYFYDGEKRLGSFQYLTSRNGLWYIVYASGEYVFCAY